ncbi:ABC transporter ATP-binding protein [Teredinibacter haidensis]|uniref:ABC transporter ATP-binding protein n=1 Tax=Teredinibacter haidensis TaxID=2731755 RepID=UPI0015881FAC|nr:ABC transporter ATP-binding protein [Teredinibacter haidensis]
MAFIVLENILKQYFVGQQTVSALSGVDLRIDKNEYIAVTGSSGSGKSTMMNILGALDKPTSGTYLLNGINVNTLNQDELADVRNLRIGFVFQSFNLLTRMSALGNVMQPLVYRGIGSKERKYVAQMVLERVGLGERENHLPNQLSGGQRQRVAIARALVTKPSLLLADEPTGNLDTVTSNEIMNLFDELHQEGNTIVIVTHEYEIARRCDRVVYMQDGKIAKDQVRKSKRV